MVSYDQTWTKVKQTSSKRRIWQHENTELEEEVLQLMMCEQLLYVQDVKVESMSATIG